MLLLVNQYTHLTTYQAYNVNVPDHTRIWTVRVRSGPYGYTRTVRPYANGPTVRVRSDRMSILIRSSTSWTIRVFRPYEFFSIQT